ncbi:MAG: hypothetical protein GY820_37380 [Gammaproteobacteria bacterium]|nr:hypothetical protein [Gammaproteobacteria bacterium]
MIKIPAKTKNAAKVFREEIKDEFWKDDIAWTGEKPEQGWFRAPRTLPLILNLLRMEKITDSKRDPTGVYLELLARHRDSGIVEMETDGEHSYAAGYPGPRGIRTWQERMNLLEKLGLIKSKGSGNQKYKYVLLIHPTIWVKKLHDEAKIDDRWWETYRQRQIEAKERSYDQLVSKDEEGKVLPIEKVKKKAS